MRFVAVQMLLLALLLGAYMRSAGAPLLELPLWALWVGRLLTAAGVLLAMSAFASLGRTTRITPQPTTGANRVERGIYRYLRHPMYTSAWVVCLGMMLSRPHAGVVACAVAVTIFYTIKARYEERLLLAHYPDYAEYSRRTRGMWLQRRR